MTTTTDIATVREAALDLALATCYDEALRLLDATQTDDPHGRVLLALTAADVADRADHVFGRSEATKRFEALDAELAAYEPDPSLAWNVAWVRVRRGYSLAIRNPDGSYRMGPDGRESGEIDALVTEATRLRDEAPDGPRRGWASMCLGWITDNLLADREAAPAHYEPALEAARASGDPVLLFEAQRHLGDHAHDDGDLAGARERWEESTAAGARARHIGGTLSQQLLLAVLHRDEGDEAGARAIAGEVLRWAAPSVRSASRARPRASWPASTRRMTQHAPRPGLASFSQLRAEVLVRLGSPDDALGTGPVLVARGARPLARLSSRLDTARSCDELRAVPGRRLSTTPIPGLSTRGSGRTARGREGGRVQLRAEHLDRRARHR